jgi:hypothetical protein
MRINEIANAEEQLALWKLVSDNVWTAIHTQAQQQAKEKAVAAQQSKAKGKRKGKGASVSVPSIPNVPKPASPKTQPKHNPAVKTATHNANVQSPNVNPTLKNKYPMSTHNVNTSPYAVQAPASQLKTTGLSADVAGVDDNAKAQSVHPNVMREPNTLQHKRLPSQKTGVMAVKRAY